MVYTWRPGSVHKVKASVAAAECERLESEGRLTAEAMVEDSRPEDAPLHCEFQWDDSIAAEEWRKSQARGIINSLVVVSEQHQPVRAFVNLSVKSPEYTNIHTVVQNRSTAEMLLENAKRELRAFQIKYQDLVEFADLFTVIEKLTA